ncbi:MAG TPA: hypothetical protein VKF61_04310 [Candidatus Polarisedimenticolia bacterium]|nr:hypothetical protein [Candidatus Polarisedimenticolia bacterium]
MKRSLPALIALGALLSMQASAAPMPHIVEQWNSSQSPDWKPTKVLAIAILGDQEIRHRFEDKLVSHLRARKIAASTSFSLVPDLANPGSREEILRRVDEQQIDGAVTFRLVPLEKGEKAAAAWSEKWKEQVEAGGTLRELIEETLPFPKQKSKRYGVEVTLWGGPAPVRYWAGRTESHTVDELREGASGLVQDVIGILQDRQRI